MYSYDRRHVARADTEALRELNDHVNHTSRVLNDTMRRVIHITEPVQRLETYEVLRDMLEQEIQEAKKALEGVEK